MKTYSQTRMALLMTAINNWLNEAKTDRQVIGSHIVEQIQATEMTDVLRKDNVVFSKSDDLCNDMRVNTQKLFRWLGHYQEVSASPERLFALEHVIVAAMPESVRLDYLNEVYHIANVTVVIRQSTQSTGSETEMTVSLTREQAEAQISMIEMSQSPDVAKAERAYREVSEAVATGQCVLGVIEEKYPRLKGSRATKSSP